MRSTASVRFFEKTEFLKLSLQSAKVGLQCNCSICQVLTKQIIFERTGGLNEKHEVKLGYLAKMEWPW